MSEARVARPDPRQLRWDMIDLEGLSPADHRARLVWSFVESLDPSQLMIRFSRARAKREGRRPIPRLSWRCGFMRRSRGRVRRANWNGWRKAYRWLAEGRR